MKYVITDSIGDYGVTLNFYYELDESDLEFRKIEIVGGGILGFASKEFSFRGTEVSKTPLLSKEEINNIPGHTYRFISQEEFESMWDMVIIVASQKNKE